MTGSPVRNKGLFEEIACGSSTASVLIILGWEALCSLSFSKLFVRFLIMKKKRFDQPQRKEDHLVILVLIKN